jgi:hypothetical protein
MKEIKALIDLLRKNPLAAITGLCIVTIAYLGLYIKETSAEYQIKIEAAKREIIDTERRCAIEIDAVRKEQLLEAKNAADRQSKIEIEIEKLIKQ